jgi:alanine racemase
VTARPELASLKAPGPGLSAGAADWRPAYRPVEMEIDLAAIGANLAEIRRRAGAQRKIIAVLKADAYGHGCAAVAAFLERSGVELLALGNLEDAALVRAAGVGTPILLLSPLLPEMIGDMLR